MNRIIRIGFLLLAITLLASLCMGCNQNDNEAEIYNETDFVFQYHMEEGQEIKLGSTIHITVSWKNISQYPVALIGQDHGEVSATLFCKAEGAEYSFSRQEPALSSGAYLDFKIPTGQTVGTSCSFIIPKSAPSGDYHLRVSYKGGSETFYNVFTLSDTQDPLIPSGYKEQTSFGFGIEHIEGAPKKGQRIAIETTLTNISGQVYTYTGGYSHFTPGVRLYCVVDGKEYVIDHDPIPGTDDTGTYHVPAGESRMQTYHFNIPEDAPNGNYHLQVSYYPESVIFENIFILSDTQDSVNSSGYKEQTNFGLGYEHIDGAFKRGQRIAIKTTVTNISNQPHIYVGSSGEFMADAELYCEIDGVKTVIYHEPIVLPEDHGTHVIASGQSHAYTHYFQIQEDAPSGSYHLRLNYNKETVTFYNVFTLSE